MSNKEYVYRPFLSAEDIKKDIKEINDYGEKAYIALGKCLSLKYFFVREQKYKKTLGSLTKNWSLNKVYEALPKLQRDVMVNKKYCSKMWIEERDEGLYVELELSPIGMELDISFKTKVELYEKKCNPQVGIKTIISWFNLDLYRALKTYELAYKLRNNLDDGIPKFEIGFRELSDVEEINKLRKYLDDIVPSSDGEPRLKMEFKNLTANEEIEKAGTQITRYCEESNVDKIKWKVSEGEYLKKYVRSDKAKEFTVDGYKDNLENSWFDLV